MPSQFYVDKMLKNILFPTLLCCMFRNPNNMKIVLNEMDKSFFLEILKNDVKYKIYLYSLNNFMKIIMVNSYKDHLLCQVLILRILYFHIVLLYTLN